MFQLVEPAIPPVDTPEFEATVTSLTQLSISVSFALRTNPADVDFPLSIRFFITAPLPVYSKNAPIYFSTLIPEIILLLPSSFPLKGLSAVPIGMDSESSKTISLNNLKST